MLSYALFGLPQGGFDSRPFFSSWLLPPLALACLRILLSIYAFTTIFYSFGWFAHNIDIFHLKDINLPEITFSLGASAIGKSFSYFTYLSYWGQAFYFFISSLHTFVYWRTGRTWLERWPRWLQVAHSVFYTCIVCYPPMVSAIYWASMFVDKWYTLEFDRWSNTSIHMLNTVFALTEIALPRTGVPPWSHLFVLMLFMSLYLGLVYISKAVEDFYPYLWLDPKVGWKQIVAHIIGYTMTIIVVYNIVLGLIWLRRDLTEKESHSNDNRPNSSRPDDEIALTRPRDLEMASSTKHDDQWDFCRPQTGVSVPETAYATSTFDFGFGDGGGGYSRVDVRPPPDTPRLQRDERGFWTLASSDVQPVYPVRQ